MLNAWLGLLMLYRCIMGGTHSEEVEDGVVHFGCLFCLLFT